MFRLWFMTFFGEYRGAAESAHGHDAHGHDPHGHGPGGVHESPKIMLVPLMILALLSIFGGYVGVPGSLGGKNHFDEFLGPIFRSTAPALNENHAAAGETAPLEPTTEGHEPEASHSTELLFTGISVGAGFLGLFLAWLLYVNKPQLPERIAASLGSFYHAVLNKYYVDEIYATLFVKPLIDSSTRILWHGVDQGVIDASVNGTADGAREASDSLRHMQSGNLRSYAGWIAAGAAAVIAYMIWMGTR
jgi:NADH-quinone oxidoreductase subunit L